MIPVALFLRFGVGTRVAFPILPRIERNSGHAWRGPFRAPATSITWGPFRAVLVWSRP